MGGHGGRGRVTRATSTQDGSQSSAPQSGSRSHRAGHWARHRTNTCTSPAMTWPAELRGFAAGEQGPCVREASTSPGAAAGVPGAGVRVQWGADARGTEVELCGSAPLQSHCPSPGGVLTRGPVCGDSPSSLRGAGGGGSASGAPKVPRTALPGLVRGSPSGVLVWGPGLDSSFRSVKCR